MIRFRCANRSCRFEMKARDKKVGKRGVCPSCGLVQTIPQGEDTLDDVSEGDIDKILHVKDHPEDAEPVGRSCQLKKCPWCGQTVDSRLEKCNHCGNHFDRHGLLDDLDGRPRMPQDARSARGAGRLPLVLVVLVVVVILAFVAVYLFG